MSVTRERADHELLIKCSLDLSRAEHPELYDHLIRIPKGRHRMNRLRSLLCLGLMASRYGNVNEPEDMGSRPSNTNDKVTQARNAGGGPRYDERDDSAAIAAGASMFGPMSDDD